jgi:hypothetical protein
LATGNPDFWASTIAIESALLIAVAFDLLTMMRQDDPDLPRMIMAMVALLLPLGFGALSLLALAWKWDAPDSTAIVAGAVGVPLVEMFLLVALPVIAKATFSKK